MLDTLLAMIDREVAAIEHTVLTGGCPDFMVYREQIAALNAYKYMIDLAKRTFTDDSDDDWGTPVQGQTGRP
jgi:hypothetical protein